MKFIQYTKHFEYLRENNDIDDELDNFKTMKNVGVWGKSFGNRIVASGCVFLAMSTGRILLGKRSNYVVEPNMWSGFGGAASVYNNELESPVETVRREAAEEVGEKNVKKVIKFIPLYVYKKQMSNGQTFEYHNFLAVVKDEFFPVLNWENSTANWIEYGNWPNPMHDGLSDLIDKSGKKIEKIIKSLHNLKETKYSYNQLDTMKMYDIFKKSYEKTTGQAWTFDKFENRARQWTFYGDETGFVAVRFQSSNMVKLVGVAGNTKSIIKGFHEMVADNVGKPVWGAVSLSIGNMISKLNSNYKVLKVPGGIVGSMLFNSIKTVIPKNVIGNAEIIGSNPDGSIKFKYADIGETDKVLVGNTEYFNFLKSQILNLPNVPTLIKTQISKIL